MEYYLAHPQQQQHQQHHHNPQLHPESHDGQATASVGDTQGAQQQHQEQQQQQQQESFPSPSSTSPKEGSSPSVGMFQCGFCKKSYNRADHLQRHVRSHSGEKPFSCTVCSKSFGRPDLLKRHAEGHFQDQDPNGAKRRKIATVSQSNRVTQACKACSASKLKCDEGKPCNRCRNRGMICEPVQVTNARQDEPPPPQSQQQAPPPLAAAPPPQPDPDTPVPMYQMQQVPQMTAPVVSMSPFRMEDQMPTPVPSDHASMSTGLNDSILESDFGFFPDIFGVDWALGRSLRVAADYLDQGMAVQYRAMSSVGTIPQEPFDWNSHNFNADTFRSSLWQATNGLEENRGLENQSHKQTPDWSPRSRSSNPFQEEETKLALPPALPLKARRKPHSQVLKENLDYTARDRILNLVIKNVKKENIEKIVRSFPATELYDDFMQHFFNEFTRRVDDWIHAATFRPNQCTVELLTGIIATGAIYQDQHVLRTIGYAMLEQTRAAIPKTIDLHTHAIREPEMQQAYLLQLETRQFSSNMKKVEIAEALFQPALTMLRRNRQFRRGEYNTITASSLEETETLEDRWRKWAKQEERKRTVFHTLIHDSRAAIMFNTTPLMHFSELSLPLPESEVLWRARSAQEWLTISSQRSGPTPSRLPSLNDVLQDMSNLTTYAEFLDLNFSLLAVVHALWALVCQHRQMRSMQPQANWHNPGADSSAYGKCVTLLNNVSAIMGQLPPLRPEVMMMHAFVSMQLHISFEELHLFAGKADREDAVKAYYSARQWIESPSSRYSVWYASQVIRYTRMMAPCTVRDFFAVSIFHTSMAIWSYGVLSRARTVTQQQQQQSQSQPSEPILLLDSDEHTDPALSTGGLQAFIHDKRGSPCLRHFKTGVVSLEDPTGVMDELQQCLNSNWGPGPPELVKGMRKLMNDLGLSAKSVNGSRAGF